MAAAESYRITLLGEGGAGKTCLIVKFMTGDFVEEYDPTIEDEYRKPMEVDCAAINLEILDTSGGEYIDADRDRRREASDGFVLCYSTISRAGFDELEQFYARVHRQRNAEKLPVVLVGTKCDLPDDRQVAPTEGEDLARRWGVPFLETSSKCNTNVEGVFVNIVREMRAARGLGPARQTKANSKVQCVAM